MRMAWPFYSKAKLSITLKLLDELHYKLNLRWSKEKREVMPFNLNNLHTKEIKIAASYRYLGVLIYSPYNFADKAQEIQKKISRRLVILSSRLSGMDPHLKMVMMSAYIRSIYEYCLPLNSGRRH